MTTPRTTRRLFLGTSAAAGAAAMSFSATSYARIFGANARLNVAFVGTGGIASGQAIGPSVRLGAGCPCYTDVDRRRMGKATEHYPDAAAYTDYREMFDRHEKDIDAVYVSTPDHQHYPATMRAMMAGIHVYTQKPLTHTMWESRQLLIAKERYLVATQMGNQGHANEGNRRIVETIRQGALGAITSAHIWTNRPIWRQGHDTPPGSEPTPAEFDWDSWLGPAPERPFRHEPSDRWGGFYHPFNWRGFWDFGCGAFGDMACHTVDGFYWAMLPGYPVSAELIEGTPIGFGDKYDTKGVVKLHFASHGDRPAFDLFWYEGGLKPEKPEELGDRNMPGSGCLIYGDKAKMFVQGDYGNKSEILDKEVAEAFGEPKKELPRSEGHHEEFHNACKGDKPYDHPKSNFGYSARLTESILLGSVAQKVGGKLEYDATNLRITNNDDANRYVHKAYRPGWDFRMPGS